MLSILQQNTKYIKNAVYTFVFLLLLCVGLSAYTGIYALVGIPFVLLFLVWTIFDFKSVYWFFIFSIPLSFHYSIPGAGLATTIPDEQMMWLFVPVVALIVAYNRRMLPNWFLKHPLTLLIVLQFVWMLVAIIFSQNHFLSFKYGAARTWFLLALFVLPILIFREKKDFIKAFKLFLIPVTIHAVIALIWHYFLDFHFWASNTVVRPFYLNHVDYSTVLSMLFPLILVAYQLTKGNKRLRRIVIAVIVFYLIAIYFAYARAAMLAVVFSLVVAVAIRLRLVKTMMVAFYMVVLAITGWLIHQDNYLRFRPDYERTFTQSSFSNLITATFRGTDMSSMERFYRWIASVRMTKEHPVVGVGPNNFNDHYKGHAVTQFQTYVSRNSERSTTHNYYLFMLVEQGFPAMILYGVFVFVMMARAQKIYHRSGDRFYKKVTMGLIMMFAAGFVNNFFSELLETHKVGALFYMSVALLIVVDYLSRKEENCANSPKDIKAF